MSANVLSFHSLGREIDGVRGKGKEKGVGTCQNSNENSNDVFSPFHVRQTISVVLATLKITSYHICITIMLVICYAYIRPTYTNTSPLRANIRES
jgi:hypothetical protein